MFGKKASTTTTDNLGKTNRIVPATEITGNIVSEADFRLDGILIGNFTSKGKLVIGAQGKIIGDITCVSLDIEGVFQGNAVVQQLIAIRSSANINGHLKMDQLIVESGAVFNATCEMQKNLKTD